MNRTIKEATIRAFHYTSLDQPQSHLEDYLMGLQQCPAPQSAKRQDAHRIYP